jgi:PAS domain-containing protein
MSDRDPPAGPLPAAVLQALVEQSLELIAITDAAGTITWANSRFSAATGVSGGDAKRLSMCRRGRGRRVDAREAGRRPSPPHAGRHRPAPAHGDDSLLWVDARARRSAERVLWTFSDVSSTRFLAAQAHRQGELLDIAQEFGRIGVWERAFLPAKAAGIGTCSASGGSIRRPARHRSRRRSGASIPTTG